MATTEWREWHLTPGGWIPGTVKYDFEDRDEKPPPPDRVLTCTYSEKPISPVSPAMQREVTKDWESKDQQAVETLRKKYGDCPWKL